MGAQAGRLLDEAKEFGEEMINVPQYRNLHKLVQEWKDTCGKLMRDMKRAHATIDSDDMDHKLSEFRSQMDLLPTYPDLESEYQQLDTKLFRATLLMKNKERKQLEDEARATRDANMEKRLEGMAKQANMASIEE